VKILLFRIDETLTFLTASATNEQPQLQQQVN